MTKKALVIGMTVVSIFVKYENDHIVRNRSFIMVVRYLYLRICGKLKWLELYGLFRVVRSAFFRGQAEHPVKGIVSKVLSTKDDPVYVAVNVDGVFIIDMDDFVREVLFSSNCL